MIWAPSLLTPPSRLCIFKESLSVCNIINNVLIKLVPDLKCTGSKANGIVMEQTLQFFRNNYRDSLCTYLLQPCTANIYSGIKQP